MTTTPAPSSQPEPITRVEAIRWAGRGLLKVLTDIARAYQEAERTAAQERKDQAA
jgi:hypothetical protein